jgi:uroporphyrinogen-III synthase
MGKPLTGRAILVTRPQAQAARLAALVEAEGGEALRFPTLAILAPRDPGKAARKLSPAGLTGCDLAVFVSPTSVAAAFDIMGGSWPAHLPVAAVGAGTARALAARGVGEVIAPGRGADSEALAALPRLQDLAGRRVLIVRGEGGREWLGDTLTSRGAQVDYAECYRRALPDVSPADLRAMAQRWRSGGVHAVCVTSEEALKNLLKLFPDEGPAVLATPLFAAHARIAEAAKRHGFSTVIVSEPGDEATLAELKAFFHSQP